MVVGLVLAWSGAASAQQVAIYGAVSNGSLNLAVSDLMHCTGEFQTVDIYDTSVFTPDVTHMTNYHAILVYGDVPFADPVAFGDALAEYLENGNGLVLGGGAFVDDQEI
jgi:hypothetical protein